MKYRGVAKFPWGDPKRPSLPNHHWYQRNLGGSRKEEMQVCEDSRDLEGILLIGEGQEADTQMPCSLSVG